MKPGKKGHKGKKGNNGKSFTFLPQHVKFDVNTGPALLYLSTRTGVSQLVSQRDAELGPINWHIDQEIVDQTAALLTAAAKKYERSATDCDTEAALDVYLKLTGSSQKQEQGGVKNYIRLQRQLLRVEGGETNAFKVGLPGARKLLKVPGITATLGRKLIAAFRMIGRAGIEGLGKTNGVVRYFKFKVRDNIEEYVPSDFLPDSKRWKEKVYNITTDNPMNEKSLKKVITTLASIAKESGVDNAKRAATLPIVVAVIATFKIEIMARLDAMGFKSITDLRYRNKNRKIYRLCQVLLFVILSLVSPNRPIETLDKAMDDFLESVDGEDNFMMIFRGLMEPGALPRPNTYSITQWYGKFMKLFEKYQCDVMPFYATAISLPDVMQFSMTTMMALEPELLLDTDKNPHMHIFVGTGNGDKFGFGDMATNTLDGQLADHALPPGAVKGRFLSGYSFRVAYAVIMRNIGVMDDPDLEELVRKFFGHSELSEQVTRYAGSLGRLLTCNPCRNTAVPTKDCENCNGRKRFRASVKGLGLGKKTKARKQAVESDEED